MIDLTTTYLGLPLAHPIIAGAGPLADSLAVARRLEDAGCAAIVMRSLFEEQCAPSAPRGWSGLDWAVHDDAAATPAAGPGPHRYLDHVRALKASLAVPVIASLNGTTSGEWLEYAGWIEQAGADAVELNASHVAIDPLESAAVVERRLVGMVKALRARVRLPIAVKLSPFHTALPHLAAALERAGAAGLVLFNRFLQPDIDLEACAVAPALPLSDPADLLLRLRWLAVLAPRVAGSLACSGGVHAPLDAVKAVLAGAHAVHMTSALLRHGPEHARVVVDGLRRWMEERGHAALRDLRGAMSLGATPGVLERASYVRALRGSTLPGPG